MIYGSSASLNELDFAKEVFERFIGYKIFHREYFEEIPYGRTGAELKHTPIIRLVSVQARAKHYHDMFGHTDWIQIPLEEVVLHQKDGRAAITLPPTLFGTNYSEVRVTYEAGLMEIPADIEEAVQVIIEGIRNGDIDQLTCRLPAKALEIIDRYRKGAS